MSVHSVSFITREGFVAVVRRVATFFDPLPNLTRPQALCTLFLNGGAILDQTNIPVGPSQDDLINCFVVVDELQEFRVSVNVADGDLGGFDFYAQVYGSYLPKTNVPANMQIASCAGIAASSSSSSSSPPQAAQAPQASGLPPGYNAAPKYRATPPPAAAAPMIARPTPRPASAPVAPPRPPRPPRPTYGVLKSGRNKR